ncbi:MAG: thioredoxin family protein [Kofleriaceae bacterium]
MARTPSTMIPLGTKMPPFVLRDVVTDASIDLTELAAGKRGTLVMFICNHCPFVVHVRPVLVQVAHEALDRGFAVVAINANSITTHPQDGPEHMAKLARDEHWRFPFVFDGSQQVARAYSAACTPDLYVFDAANQLAYRGQLDDSRPSNGIPVTGRDLRTAIEAVAAGRSPSSDQKPSIGCNIKWAP